MEVVLIPRSRSCGFSLIQLITTLGVLASSLSLAIPNWVGISQNSKIQSSRSEIMSLLNFARSTAVIQGVAVTICPTSDQRSCNNDYTAWNDGFMVFSDRNKDRSRGPEEPILRLGIGQQRGIKIYSSPGRRSIRFDTDGSAWGSNLTLRFCVDNQTHNNRSILLYGTGRPRYSHHLSNGDQVTCD